MSRRYQCRGMAFRAFASVDVTNRKTVTNIAVLRSIRLSFPGMSGLIWSAPARLDLARQLDGSCCGAGTV